jgi:hypothetical protein
MMALSSERSSYQKIKICINLRASNFGTKPENAIDIYNFGSIELKKR